MTLRDVAARAGVSTSTVARVAPQQRLRRRGDARARGGGHAGGRLPPQRGRVRPQAPAHDDDRHAAARDAAEPVLRRGRARHRAGARASWATTCSSTTRAGRPSTSAQGVDALLSQQVEAIVFAKPVDRDNVELAHAAGIAVVEVEKPLFRRGRHRARRQLRRRHGGDGAPARPRPRAGRLHRRAVAGRGRRRSSTASSHERLAAYRDALRARGLPADDSLVVLGEYYTDAGLGRASAPATTT